MIIYESFHLCMLGGMHGRVSIMPIWFDFCILFSLILLFPNQKQQKVWNAITFIILILTSSFGMRKLVLLTIRTCNLNHTIAHKLCVSDKRKNLHRFFQRSLNPANKKTKKKRRKDERETTFRTHSLNLL